MIYRMISGLLLIFVPVFGQKWQSFTTANSGLADNSIRTVLISGDGLKWFGTDGGLSVFDGTEWVNFSTESGMTHNGVNDLALIHNDGFYTIWVATDSGVTVMEVHATDDIRIASTYFASISGLIANTVRAVTPDTAQVKWLGTNMGVSVFDDADWTSLTDEDYLSSNQITDIESDLTGLVHIGTRGGGVPRLRIDEVDGITSASTINFWSSMPIDTVYTIHIDRNNVQWYGNGFGVFRHEGIDSKENWTGFQTTDGLIDNSVKSISEDASGGMWFGTPSGVSFYDGADFENFTESDGLISNNVRDIAVDPNGDIWFATDAGVSLFRKTTTIEETENLPSSYYLTNYPNPFNNGTTFQFQLNEPGYFDLIILSISGKQVRCIANQYFATGIHRIRWDATGDLGNKLPSGIYVARMTGVSESLARKLIFLK